MGCLASTRWHSWGPENIVEKWNLLTFEDYDWRHVHDMRAKQEVVQSSTSLLATIKTTACGQLRWKLLIVSVICLNRPDNVEGFSLHRKSTNPLPRNSSIVCWTPHKISNISRMYVLSTKKTPLTHRFLLVSKIFVGSIVRTAKPEECIVLIADAIWHI